MAQDPSLAFAQNLVNRYMQFKAQQFQVELFKRREQRYEKQLEENRLYRQQQQEAIESRFVRSQELTREGQEALERRFFAGQELTREQMGTLTTRFEAGQALTREGMEATRLWREQQVETTGIFRERTATRLEGLAESLKQYRQRPERGTLEWFKERGYSDETAQRGQDIYNRLAPGPMSPSQQMLAAKLMMSQARTNEERDAASAIMKDAGEAMMKQRQVPGAPMFPQEPEEPSAFTPPGPGDKIAFPKAGPEMLAAAEIVTGKTKDPVGTAIGKVLGMKWSFEETTEMIRKLRAGGFIRMIHPDSEMGEVEVPVEEVADALEQNYQIVRD